MDAAKHVDVEATEMDLKGTANSVRDELLMWLGSLLRIKQLLKLSELN